MKNRLLNHDERLENIKRQLEIALNSPRSQIKIIEEVIKQLNYILEKEEEAEEIMEESTTLEEKEEKLGNL